MPDYLANGKGHLSRIQSGRTSNMRRMMTLSSTKIALVTGASRGLGRNIALARKGVDVIGTYHSNKAEADARRRGHRGARAQGGDVPTRHRHNRRLRRLRGRSEAGARGQLEP